MIDTSPRVAGLVRRFSAMAEDIACRPALGPYEVGVLEELVALLREVTGLDEEAEHRARLRQYHWSGRAVDLPPRTELTKWLWPQKADYVHLA